MRRTVVWFSGLAAAMALLALPSVASAQCSTFVASIPDGRISGPWTISTGSGLSWDFGVTTGHSYSVEVLDDSGSTGFTVVVGNFFCPTANIAGLVDTTTIEPSSGTTGTCCFTRKSFTATANGFLEVAVTTTSGTPFGVKLSVTDTTLFSPAWSTFGSFDTFYSLLNTTNATCSGTLTLYNTAGTLVTTQPLTIAAAATGATNTASMGTTRGAAGTARFVHNCPPGAFLAESAIANFTISPTPYFQFVHFQGTREANIH